MVKELLAGGGRLPSKPPRFLLLLKALPRLRGGVGAGLNACANVNTYPLLRSRPPPQAGRKKHAHQLPVTIRTMTGSRMTTKSVGKMHTIIGSASLAGRL